MSFEDLQKSVTNFFRRKTKFISADFLVQKETKRFILTSFEENYKVRSPWKVLWSKSIKITTAFGLMLFGAFVHRFLPESYAGEVYSTAGVVEIIRDNEILTVTNKKPFKLKVGDIIEVDPRSNATLATKKGIKTQVQGGTKLTLADANNLFVQEGKIEASLGSESTISTHRGFVSSKDQGKFSMEILPTGEARVILEDKIIEVSDWLDNTSMLSVTGEELRLKTDTKLSTKKVPDDLKLSDAQLQVIESKLVIARSKLFTGLEKSLSRRNSGRGEIASAQKTFRSILQVILNTDRQLNVYGKLNFDLIENDDVIVAIVERANNKDLVTEAKSFLVLLNIVEHRVIDFSFKPSNEKTFDRYVLTDYLKSLVEGEEKKLLLEYVKAQYVTVALRTVINKEKRSQQVQSLEELVDNLPLNQPLQKDFLRALNDQLDPVLQTFLVEFTDGIL